MHSPFEAQVFIRECNTCMFCSIHQVICFSAFLHDIFSILEWFQFGAYSTAYVSWEGMQNHKCSPGVSTPANQHLQQEISHSCLNNGQIVEFELINIAQFISMYETRKQELYQHYFCSYGQDGCPIENTISMTVICLLATMFFVTKTSKCLA